MLSVATVAVMIIALIVFLGVNVFSYLTTSALTVLKDKIDISVYFKTSAPEDEILRIKRSLEGLSEVKSVEYISRDKALEIFKGNHAEDETITQAIAELGENPLSAALNIKAHDPSQYATISEYLNTKTLEPIVEKVSFFQNQTVIERLAQVIDTVEKAGTLLTLFLSLIAGLVIFNTVRLAIFSDREEIGIMRLVGASNSFIRGPYVVTGILYGALAAVLSLVIAAPAIFFGSPYINVFIPEIDLRGYFITNLLLLLLYQIAFGVVLGVVSSYMAMRKYLKV